MGKVFLFLKLGTSPQIRQKKKKGDATKAHDEPRPEKEKKTPSLDFLGGIIT
jgi:hypothetical protein